MKPINEKERATAFMQFIVLFVITIIIAVFLAFFPFKLRKKQVDILSEENKTLKNERTFFNGFSSRIDSLVIVVKSMDKMDPADIVRTQADIENQFKQLNIDDSTSASKINKSLLTIFRNWTVDKQIMQGTTDLKTKVKELEAANKQLEKDVTDWKDKYNEAKRLP